MDSTHEVDDTISHPVSSDGTLGFSGNRQHDIIWRLYQENRIQARHFDDQRAKISNIIIAAAVGLTAAIGQLQHGDWAVCLVIMLLGLFGAIFTTAYAKLARLFMRRAKTCLMALDISDGCGSEILPIGIRQQLERAASANQDPTKSSKLIRNDLLPMLWPLIITVIAGLFMIYILRL